MYIHFAYFKSCLIIFVSCTCTNIYLFVLNIDVFLSVGAMSLSSLCLWLFTIHHISYVAGFAVTVYIGNISLAEVNNNKYCKDLSDSMAQGFPTSPAFVNYNGTCHFQPPSSFSHCCPLRQVGLKHRYASGNSCNNVMYSGRKS